MNVISELPAVSFPLPDSLWRHQTSGGVYRVLHGGRDEQTLTPVVIYQNVATGEVWTRALAGFADGRFEPCAPPEIPQLRMDAEKPQPPRYGRYEWRPTWTPNFGPHADLTVRQILEQFGASALLPYRQRAVNEIAAPRGEGQKTLNQTMLAHIDALLAEAGEEVPAMTPKPFGDR